MKWKCTARRRNAQRVETTPLSRVIDSLFSCESCQRPLDLPDDAVKKMIKAAKKRGYVTLDELNAVLPSEETDPDRIEDINAMLSDMGINVVEDDEVGEEAESEAPADAEEDANELAEQTGTAVATTTTKKEPTDRTDDPVRMYLREMGSVELLSREGEIAIAKCLEGGRETT